ncbi:MAG: hypothetical protein Q8R00_02625 [Candidatus Nanoarchaeia archaeon]|nr:hypothetical protein [Candidatus Nanoarchaeia archaeon]
MEFIYSKHWLKKKKYRPDISEYEMEYCITNSDKIKDRKYEGVWNAITRVPHSGRKLKVVYRQYGKTIKILTTCWLE